ncbi:MAG: thioredoxin family protein [Bacteroidales bacterium]|nr:thioredoxin family protein [Bacteroidales bacterium]
MKTVFSLFSLLIILGLSPVTAGSPVDDDQTGIKFFEGTWEEALQRAKKENKLIFLDVYATWCGPCKKLNAQTFPNAEVGKYYNERFINVKVDGEKGEGLTLRQRYNVRGYPTLLFINHKGEVVKSTAGFRDPERFIELGKSVPTP